MSAQSGPVQRNHSMHTPHLLPLPVKASAVIYENAIVCTDANGVAVPGSDTANLVPHGVAHTGYDNTGGADGVVPADTNNFGWLRYCQVDTVGEWEFAVSAGSPKAGGSAFIVDDNTVSANATTNSLKIGTFTRPGNEGGWFVNVERR